MNLNNLCYPIIWKYHILIYSPTDNHLGYFYRDILYITVCFTIWGAYEYMSAENTSCGVVTMRSSFIRNQHFFCRVVYCDWSLDRGNHMLSVNVRCLKSKCIVWRNSRYMEDEYLFFFTLEHQNTLLWTLMFFSKCLNWNFTL